MISGNQATETLLELTSGEAGILRIIQEGYGSQNNVDDVFFTYADEAALNTKLTFCGGHSSTHQQSADIRPLCLIQPSSFVINNERPTIDVTRRQQIGGSLAGSHDCTDAEIIGESWNLKEVLRQVEIVAGTSSTVLILGETGTGKELIAQAIHKQSSRREHSLVRADCASIPAGLLESELFGHERGAFTGAIARNIGRFELAHGGTLFLDEVGDIPLELQSKLLRVLQEQELERLGSTRTVRVDFRLVAATHRNLSEMVPQGQFRSDLYYRLNVFPIEVPPLRERSEDIPLLILHFARMCAHRMNKRIDTVRAEDMDTFIGYHWPGNVRELQNIVERCVILSPGPVLDCSPFADLRHAARRQGQNAGRSGTRLHFGCFTRYRVGRGRTRWRFRAPRSEAHYLALQNATARHMPAAELTDSPVHMPGSDTFID